MQLDDLPPELLLRILSRLPYFSLISASAVCRYWRILIYDDIPLSQKMFKTGGEVRRQGGCNEDIQLHPALSNISYRIGDFLDSVECSTTRGGKGNLKLIDLEISNDLASIPSMNVFKITISPLSFIDNTFKSRMSIYFTVTNPDGVRLRDIFSTMVLESRKKCDLLSMISGGSFSQRLHPTQAPGLFMKANLLGDRRNFAGFSPPQRIGSHSVAVSVRLKLG